MSIKEVVSEKSESMRSLIENYQQNRNDEQKKYIKNFGVKNKRKSKKQL